ncbi:MAG: hypothetical protein ABIH49_00470 [archaeon]
MEIKISFKNKTIKIPVKKVSFLGKFLGLMFKSRNTENLLFEFHKKTQMQIHSLFVFFPFLAIWLSEKNKVLETRIIKPFNLNVNSKKPFNKLIEIPLNNKNRKITNFFVDKKDLNIPLVC